MISVSHRIWNSNNENATEFLSWDNEHRDS